MPRLLLINPDNPLVSLTKDSYTSQWRVWKPLGLLVIAGLTPELLAERILSDGELSPEEMNLQLASALRDGGPWGQDFPEPSFDGCFQLLSCKMLNGAHARMSLKPVPDGAPVEAIAFNRPGFAWPAGSRLRAVYRLTVNDYFATPRVQLVVEHVESA